MTRGGRRWYVSVALFPLRVITWPLWKLGMVWLSRDHEAAAGFHDLDVARNSRLLGPYHRETLRARANRAIELLELGELEEAEAELTDVIIRLGSQAAADDQLLLDVRRWRHHVRARLGWIAEIEADARYLAESGARQLGPDHPDTLAWRELLATALWEGGRRDEARTEITGVAARRAAVLGADHPDTLRTERIRAAMEAGPDDITFRLTDD